MARQQNKGTSKNHLLTKKRAAKKWRKLKCSSTLLRIAALISFKADLKLKGVFRSTHNLKKRIIFGLIAALIGGTFLYLRGTYFFVFVCLITTIMALEFKHIIANRKTANHFLWGCGAVLYLILPALSFVILCYFNFVVLIWLVLAVTATDIGAYVFGKAFGKHKLAPIISPNKTWEGLAGGCFFGAIISLLYMQDLAFVPLGIILSLLAQAGDLTESIIKRYFNVKDSGKILPGHGGLLDRLDGYLYTAPIMVVWHICQIV